MFSGKSKERSRARQMIELTSATHHMARVDLRLVAKVLERVDVHPMGVLHFHFLDGTQVRVGDPR